jgi:selenocysteine lyase/cysteine desulfurase
MYKKHYQTFLKGHEGILHFAAHSHHFWPDVTRDAMLECFDDAANLSDRKWNKFFSEIAPQTQNYIAKIINFSHPDHIAFAPNTHELLSRLISCFAGEKSLRILTTDSEFHSFRRQLLRLKELSGVQVDIVPCDDNLAKNLEANVLQNEYDLIFVSQVFFNSGEILPMSVITNLANQKSENTIMVVDGYHAYAAIPVDIKAIEDKIFYLSGSYKYAQGGEGLCFMTIPKGCKLRPLYTGWFADFAGLERTDDRIDYSDNGLRFGGATIDITAFYRFNAVWKLFDSINLDVAAIDSYIKKLQQSFIEQLNLDSSYLVEADLAKIGHFITLKGSSPEQTAELHQQLMESGIQTDFRGSRLRFGFGLYQDLDDIKKLCSTLNKLDLVKFLINS